MTDSLHAPALRQLAIGLLAAVSTIFLAWSASCCLSGVTHRTVRQPQRFTIVVSASDKVPDNATSVARLLADGKALHSGNNDLQGTWITNWNSSLSHPDTMAGASISFNASSAMILFARPDHCGHLSINTRDGTIWRDACDKGWRRRRIMAVELPAAVSRHPWSFFVWLAAFVIIGGIVRPWKDKRRHEIWLLLYLAVLHFLFWATQPVGLLIDSLGYLPALKTNVLAGMPAYFPPGYPILVGIGYLVSRTHTGAIITMLQHGMMIAAIWWCYKLLGHCAGTTIAFATALVTGAAAPTLALPQGILSENVALFGMAGTLYLAFNYRQRGRLHDAILAGLLLAWATLARVVPAAAGVPAVFAVMMGTNLRILGLRRFASIIAIAAVLVAVPILWFGVRSGKAALTTSMGRHLYNRVVGDQCLFDARAPASSNLLKLIAPLNPCGSRHWTIQALLQKKGFTSAQLEVLMKQISFESIRQAPLSYLLYSLKQAWIQYFLDPIESMPYASNPFDYNLELESSPPLGASLNSLLWRENLERAFHVAWPFVAWIALVSLPLSPLLRERALFLGFALTAAGYLLGTASVEYLLSRYTAAIIPFVFALAGGASAAMLSALRRWCESRKGRIKRDA